LKVSANIVVDLPDNIDIQVVVQRLQQLFTTFNDNQTKINIIETDNPVTGNIIALRKSI